MSFVYDDEKLFYELLKSAVVDKLKFDKRAQTAYQNNLKNYYALTGVLNDLEKQSTPASPEEQAQDISYQPDPSQPGATAPKLYSTNMETLGALVEWCAQYKITVGGQRVAYTVGEQPPSDAWVLYKLEPNSGLLEVATREMVKRGYYINVDLLTKFIVSRLRALKAKPNKVEEVMLGMRIDDANRLLGTNINKQYVEPENPEDIVDNLPQLLDVKSPYQGGQIPLKIKDLKDAPTLKSFLSKAGITLRDRKGKDFKFDDMGDICAALAILSLRAARLAQGVASGKQKSYVDHVAQIQQQANCAQGGQPGGGGAGGQAGSAQLLQQLLSLRPFNTQYISFPEIKKWLDTYSAYANNSDITDTAQKLSDFMDSFKGQTSSSTDTIQMNNLTADKFKSMLTNQNTAIQSIGYLYDIITQAGSLYQRMITQLQNLAQDQQYSGAYRQMQQQITPGGPQQTNVSDLDDLRHELQRLWQQHK